MTVTRCAQLTVRMSLCTFAKNLLAPAALIQLTASLGHHIMRAEARESTALGSSLIPDGRSKTLS